jgi:voltage-gated potassium channel
VDAGFTAVRLGRALAVVCVVLAVGTVGFHAAHDEGWPQSFYRAVLAGSLSGVELNPENNAARAVSIFMVLAGLTIFAYIATVLVEGIARGVFTGALAERRKRRVIDRLRDHYIICGYGRVGRRVADVFRESGVDYVVLDFNPDALEAAREHGDIYIDGNGTNDDDLAAAGLARARGLVASSDSDVDNLYITVSAKSERPDLLVVARASDQDVADKLLRAGADRVVQPYSAAGREMGILVLKPQVAAFLDAVSIAGGQDLHFEELGVTQDCAAAGKSIADLHIRERTGALIIALRKSDGTFDTTPDPEAVLEVGDVMIAVGTAEELRRLEELVAPSKAVAG